MKKQYLAIGASAVVLFGTAACGGDDGNASSGPSTSPPASAPASAPASTAAHNQQDVMFAQMMIPHHQQAVDMAKVVLAGSSNPEVKRLAQQIERAQAPEIATMTGWLKQWGAATTAPGGHGGHGGMEMPGMMSEKDMDAFGELKGAALDRKFLTMMIEHHEGAVTMARAEQAGGAHPAAKALAAAIIRTQQAEIATMKTLLK